MANTMSNSDMPATIPSIEERKKIFPFMKLSGELRNRIYNDYFQFLPEQCRVGAMTKHGRRTVLYRDTLQPYLPLIQCSHETRKEAGSLLFKEHFASPHWVLMPWNQDIVFEISFSDYLSLEPLTAGFYDAFLGYLTDQLKLPGCPPITSECEEWLKTAVDEEFVKGVEIEGGFSGRYTYTTDYRYIDVEHFVMIGPLAKIDWTAFAFEFPKYVKPDWLLEQETKMAAWKAEDAKKAGTGSEDENCEEQ